jgi:hypothetical protein
MESFSAANTKIDMTPFTRSRNLQDFDEAGIIHLGATMPTLQHQNANKVYPHSGLPNQRLFLTPQGAQIESIVVSLHSLEVEG